MKGFNEIRVRGAESPEEKEAIMKNVDEPDLSPKDLMNVSEVEKNESEKRAITFVFGEINKFLASIGLPDVEFSQDRVHVLSNEEFGRKFDKKKMSGCFNNGQVYLGRNDNLAEFVDILSHELMHYVSFLTLDIEKIKIDLDKFESIYGTAINPPIKIKLHSSRVGFSFDYYIGETRLRKFEGLNEAATEFLARIIKRNIANANRLRFTPDQIAGLTQNRVYYGQILILERIMSIIAGDDYSEYEVLVKEITADFMQGRYSIMKKLEVKHNGATEIISKMGREPKDAIAAAKRLGFKDIADHLSSFYNIEVEVGDSFVMTNKPKLG